MNSVHGKYFSMIAHRLSRALLHISLMKQDYYAITKKYTPYLYGHKNLHYLWLNCGENYPLNQLISLLFSSVRVMDMQLGKIYTAQADISTPQIIQIEVDVSNKGIPVFTIVGMADKAIEESKERITAALKNCSLPQPKQHKTVVSLSPANLRKEGPLFDLPIALGFLLAHEECEVSFQTNGKLFVGELALDGTLKPIQGALCIANSAQNSGFTSLYLPAENAQEAALIHGLRVFPVNNITELLEHLAQEEAEKPNPGKIISPVSQSLGETKHIAPEVDFCHVVGQSHVKRALEIAAAGKHNIALYGPPGTGKTMLAKAFCGILPPLSPTEQVESTMIHSYSGALNQPVITKPPLRAPHHTSSYVAVIGGGAYPKPGEATLAHHGVLFLDEFPEFDKRVLESLREPLEEGVVRISRSQGSATFPADFILLAALNPPSAVYRKDSFITPQDERKFQRKLSGPIMDRIDMWIEVPQIEHAKLLEKNQNGEESQSVQTRVSQSRARQAKRLGANRTNVSIKPQEISRVCKLESDAKNTLDQAAEKLHLSARVYHKVIKLARTIADLAGSEQITEDHILEALSYRPKDII